MFLHSVWPTDFPVINFNGGKGFVVAEVSYLGTRNLFVGIAYIITGGLAIVSGVVLLVVHYTCSKWCVTLVCVCVHVHVCTCTVYVCVYYTVCLKMVTRIHFHL